jgi:hypothetical protein
MTPRWILLLTISFIIGLVSMNTAHAAVNTNKYNVQIDIKNAYVSGLCIVKTDDTLITVSIVNEFGISLITFRYNKMTDRIKIVKCVKQLSKPVIRRILKRDFKNIISEHLISDECQLVHYVNTKHNITYNLRPL